MYSNPLTRVVLIPFQPDRVTFAIPTIPPGAAGVVALIVVLLTNVILVALEPPNVRLRGMDVSEPTEPSGEAEELITS